MFQHTAARRRLEFQTAYQTKRSKFQHTAARRRLVENQSNTQPMKVFQHTAARRRLVTANGSGIARLIVSTHSRPKAAGRAKYSERTFSSGFNTQPPEGGWLCSSGRLIRFRWFQHTAARRRLVNQNRRAIFFDNVSTHSRPKAAGQDKDTVFDDSDLFQHTAARRRLGIALFLACALLMFQHTAARRRLVIKKAFERYNVQFQHTAARRRLAWLCTCAARQICFNTQPPEGGWAAQSAGQGRWNVSTHSRPKAAGLTRGIRATTWLVSTHSRPKAAGYSLKMLADLTSVSTHSRPKAAGSVGSVRMCARQRFNTQPPEGGWTSFLP